VTEDRSLAADIESVAAAIRGGAVADSVEAEVGELR
jgi:hypothetical protein